MADQENWIAERERIRLFMPGDDTSDALKMLEKTPTNRDISKRQGQLFTVARFLSDATGLDFYKELPDELEKAQLNIDNTARHDYMKVAIEQWQGKLANKAQKNIQAAV